MNKLLEGMIKGLLMAMFCVALSACQEDEPKKVPPSTIFDGDYDLLGYYSEKAVDLNRDGMLSHDLLAETRDDRNSKHPYNITFSTIVLGQDENVQYVQRIQIWLPYPNVFVNSQTKEYLYTAYGFTSAFADYTYSERDNTFNLIPQGGDAKVFAASWDKESEVMSVSFKQEHYTTDWEWLTITGTYKKRP